MKKLSYLIMIVTAAFAFQGCNNEAKDSKETADSLNETKDTTTNAATTGGTAVDAGDANFATEAAVSGLAEVELGKVALAKSSNTKVKDFANMMVNDHGKANEELKAIATAKSITLPTALDEKHQKVSNDLNALSGKDFDKKYVAEMVDGHKKTLDLMEKEAKDGKDAELKAFAAKTAPIVKAHLDMIQKIQDSMK
jgi:putative membrane protein